MIYMSTAATSHRKLIDLSKSVFESLSIDAGRQNLPLKKYIENLLAEKARSLNEVSGAMGISPSVLRLVGSALPPDGKIESIEDDRLKYILSK